MSRTGTVLAIISALSLVLTACSESDQDATGDQASEATRPTQAAPDTPQPEPTSTQVPTATPEPEPTPTQVPTATPKPEPTQTEDQTSETDSSEPLDVAELLLEKTSRLWEVYNEYDIDALKTLYEENYWNEQEAEVQSNMEPFKNFGMKFNPEEPSSISEIAPGKWEIKQTVHFGQGSINMVFIYEEFAGDWLLTYAEDE